MTKKTGRKNTNKVLSPLRIIIRYARVLNITALSDI